jgi:hypothetical protein
MKKKEKEYRKRKEEEEDARPLVWIKYTLGLKHQVNKIYIADPKAWCCLIFTFIACLLILSHVHFQCGLKFSYFNTTMLGAFQCHNYN